MQKKTSKRIICFQLLALLTCLFARPVWPCEGDCSGTSCDNTAPIVSVAKATISADTLVNLMKSGVKVTLVECRSPMQKKDLRIPGAIVLMDNSPTASFTAVLPATDTLLIVYSGLEGGKIASFSEKLRSLGYLSQIEYNDGIMGWITYGYEAAGDNIK